METKHSPSPWKWDEKTPHKVTVPQSDNMDQAIANAKLIANAPELLQILIELCGDLEDECLTSSINDTILRAKSIIKKVTL